MNSKRILPLLAVLAILPLASCSGLKSKGGGGGGGGGGTGNASLSLTISDTPPASTSILSFTLPVIGITLTPSSGSPVQVFSSGNFELTHLQSETDLVAADLSVAAGTYTAVKVTVSAPSGVLINASSSALGTCLAGAVCNITGSAATITYTFPTGSPLVLAANSKQWLDLDFNYNNAIVTTNNVVSIDVTQTGVLTSSTSVPTGVPSGNFANIDDFTGQVTAVSSSSITVKSQIRGSLTASISSSTVYFDPQGQCTGGGSLSCIHVGSVVSVQGLLSNAGVVTATSVDIIDASKTPTDEVEGIIYPSTCNGGSNYGLVLSDSVINTSGSPLSSARFGSGICLTLSQTTFFTIDTGILTGQSGVPTGNPGFASASDIFTGQTVRAKITGAASGTNGVINANGTALILRFSRFTGTVGTVTSPTFTITGLPAYLGTFSGTPLVLTFPSATVFEGVSNVTGLTGTVSVSVLFPNPNGLSYPFYAVKVRVP